MSRICDLPEETLSEILIRLPVKSIGKSRCVSKHWNSLLTTPRFINTHLARSHHKNLLVLCNNKCFFSFTLRPDGVAEENFKNRDSIPSLDRRFVLIGHFNGLVLIGTKTGGRFSINPDYLLMNPTTLEHSRLPEPPFISFSLSQCLGSNYGLDYDSSSDDYKLVHLVVTVYPDGDVNRGLCRIFADIFSLKNELWRRVDIDHRAFCTSDDGAGLVFNGALHWLSSYPDHAIHAFDLASEKCYEFPSLPSRNGQYVDGLIVTKGGSGSGSGSGSCLGIASWLEDEARFDIWAMNKYGMAESWTKNVYLDVGTFQDIPGNGPWFWREALVIQHRRYALAIQRHCKLTCYPFNDEKSFDLTFDTRKRRSYDGSLLVQRVYVIDGLMFTESLVSPLNNTWSL